jgi:probable phosphomutase (TIGR03848 family)
MPVSLERMTVILVRHGESASNVARTLAGRAPGVELTDRGREQATALVERLSSLPIDAAARSPLLRCEQTLAPLLDKIGVEVEVDEALAEVDYGSWTGRRIAELVEEPLWAVVQRSASSAVFPGGEGLADVSARAVAAVRVRDRRLREQFGRDVLWAACSHGDVIKAVLADALGMHLDSFQRIVVEPASCSVVRYTDAGPRVLRFNDVGGAAVTSADPVPGGEVGAAEKSG